MADDDEGARALLRTLFEDDAHVVGEAAEQIRDAAPEAAIVLHTGELTEELTERAGRLGLRLVATSALGDGSAALSTS